MAESTTLQAFCSKKLLVCPLTSDFPALCVKVPFPRASVNIKMRTLICKNQNIRRTWGPHLTISSSESGYLFSAFRPNRRRTKCLDSALAAHLLLTPPVYPMPRKCRSTPLCPAAKSQEKDTPKHKDEICRLTWCVGSQMRVPTVLLLYRRFDFHLDVVYRCLFPLGKDRLTFDIHSAVY